MSEDIKEEEYEDDGLITLVSDTGEEIDFIDVAEIELDGQVYAVMQPAELLDGMEEDEALVFKITADGDGNESFEIEMDDAVIDAVFEEYYKMYDDAYGDGDENKDRPAEN